MNATVTYTDEYVAKALNKANEAAKAAKAENDYDGGTCNLDSPTLFFDNTVRDSRVQKIAALAGIGLDKTKWFKRRCYFVRTAIDGQGSLRSRMAESACKVLREAGLDAMMFYHAD